MLNGTQKMFLKISWYFVYNENIPTSECQASSPYDSCTVFQVLWCYLITDREIQVIQSWNNMRGSKWWELSLRVNYLFNHPICYYGDDADGTESLTRSRPKCCPSAPEPFVAKILLSIRQLTLVNDGLRSP